MNDHGTETYGKICALYGLRRTGKTIMMEQFISSLPETKRDEYLDTSITGNILHSMQKGHDGRKYFRSLAELYDAGTLKSAINKLIDRFSYKVVLDAVLEDYKNIPLHTTVNNMGRSYYRKHLDMEYVTERTKSALAIVNEDETGRGLMEGDLKDLKNFLEALDLFIRVPATTSFAEPRKQDDLEILMQPGMVHAHATVLADALSDDLSWRNDCLEENKAQFRMRAENEICGRSS